MAHDPFFDRPAFHPAKVYWTRHSWTFHPWPAPHHHPALEFQLVERGAYAVEVGGRSVSLRSGDLLWLRSGQPHRAAALSADLHMYFCMFRRAFVETQCTSPWTAPLRGGDDPLVFRLRPAAVGQIAALIRACDTLVHPEEIQAHHHRLLVEAWRAASGGVAVVDADALHPAVVRAAHLVAEDPVGVELRSLAAAVGLSYGRLSGLFTRQMGITLVRYRAHQRLVHIARQVGGGWTRRMGDAARLCGFASYAHFHRTFRRAMGCKPSEWLERVRAGEMA